MGGGSGGSAGGSAACSVALLLFCSCSVCPSCVLFGFWFRGFLSVLGSVLFFLFCLLFSVFVLRFRLAVRLSVRSFRSLSLLGLSAPFQTGAS